MEPRKKLILSEDERPPLDLGPVSYFRKALEFSERNYGPELKAAASVRIEDLTPEYFFKEYMWVVHATGFSASVVGKLVPRLSVAYGPWFVLGTREFDVVWDRISPVCANRLKCEAIWKMATLMVENIGPDGSKWDDFKKSRLSDLGSLHKLPFIGPITCRHLGRNIGMLECVKPDLHLIRLASHFGFETCEEMCEAMRPEGMPLGIVDLVLWYAASTFGTTEIRGSGR